MKATHQNTLEILTAVIVSVFLLTLSRNEDFTEISSDLYSMPRTAASVATSCNVRKNTVNTALPMTVSHVLKCDEFPSTR
jgi:hypothetical protein